MAKQQTELDLIISEILTISAVCRDDQPALYLHVAKRLGLYDLPYYQLLHQLNYNTVDRRRRILQSECDKKIRAGILNVVDIRGKEWTKRQKLEMEVRTQYSS